MSERRRAKTETITLRIDPKTKFMIEFMARLDGQSLTAVVDAAIRERADSRKLEIDYDEINHRAIYTRWNDFWDPSDGVRLLNLLSESSYKTTFDEDEIRQFTMSHWQFFYADSKGTKPRRAHVDILWPDLDNTMEIWRRTKSTDYWAAGKEMKRLLANAGVKPPSWPPSGEVQAPARASAVDDLDDDRSCPR